MRKVVISGGRISAKSGDQLGGGETTEKLAIRGAN